jgi:hypothetical protein
MLILMIKPQDGVSSFYLANAGNGDIVKLENGDLIMQCGPKNRFMRSRDNGVTWGQEEVFLSTSKGWCDGNIYRLNTGKIMHVFQHLESPSPNLALQANAEVSNNDGISWDGPYKIHPYPGPYCSMNGKITQAENGRIFFVSATGGEGLSGEKVGGVGVWYSDDDGESWSESINRLDKNTTGFNLQEGEVVELSDGRLALIARSDTGYLMYTFSEDNGRSWDTDVESTSVPSVMCAFNTMRDSKTKEIFLFWTYDDTSECPEAAQKPRERVSLACSGDDMRSWQFLTDVDDFEGHTYRFMNLGIYVDDDCVYTMVNVFGTQIGTGRSALEVTRFERSKLKPYAEFPPLH